MTVTTKTGKPIIKFDKNGNKKTIEFDRKNLINPKESKEIILPHSNKI